MNKRQRKVFTLLRTKTKAIGLNRKELEGLALKIDKNLQLEEDASDEGILPSKQTYCYIRLIVCNGGFQPV
jgi:hypothetical protein